MTLGDSNSPVEKIARAMAQAYTRIYFSAGRGGLLNRYPSRPMDAAVRFTARAMQIKVRKTGRETSR